MGGGEPISDYCRIHLVDKLASNPAAVSFLGYCDERPVALANCFFGFSTFACQPLLNIHDFAVDAAYRGNGFSLKLMAAIERYAAQKGCCKVTLEVLQGNKVAQNSYRKAGFSAYELDPTQGQALFWEKKITT